jgi:hypothetical protein
LDIYPLINTISHGVDNHGDRRLWDCFEGNEAMEGAERDCDNLRILRRAPHENRAEEVIGVWPIYRANSDGSGNIWDEGSRSVPDARFAVACSGDALRMASDFSAALRWS